MELHQISKECFFHEFLTIIRKTEKNIACFCSFMGWVGLGGFNAGLEQRYYRWSGIHPKSWSSDLQSQFWSSTERMPLSLWCPQRYNLDENLEDIALTTKFTRTIGHYRTWRFFGRWSSNPGPPVRSWILYQLRTAALLQFHVMLLDK